MRRRQFAAILRKDLITEARRRESLAAMLVFVVLALVVVHFALEADGARAGAAVAAGALWVTFVFAALLGLARSFAAEREGHCLDGLLLCPADRLTIFLAKATASLVFLIVVQIVAVPVFALFFALPGLAGRLPAVAVVVLLADVGMVAVGTLLGTMALQARARDLVLAVLFLPLVVPLLIAAAGATALLLTSEAGLGRAAMHVLFLLGFDLVALVVAYGTYDLVIAE